MKHYVLAFAHMIPPDGANNVVLIERKKDDWQYGKLNLPGGSVEPGEFPQLAAHRELREETGLVSSLPDIQVLGSMVAPDWRVDVCFCPYRRWHDGREQTPQTLTTEGTIISMPWREAMNDPRLIPNLRIVIPFCQARVGNWTLRPGGDEWEWVATTY